MASQAAPAHVTTSAHRPPAQAAGMQGAPAADVFIIGVLAPFSRVTRTARPTTNWSLRGKPLILLDDVGEVERREPETDDKRRIL